MTEPRTPPDGYGDIAEDLLGDDPEPVGGWLEFDANGKPLPKKPKPQSAEKARGARDRLKKK